ncbi:Ktr system potassium transporter B [Aquibacillus halophilus]|uniref:Ktr system potassium transporter B n=1 Tax=Aquibacillus halophilus TaxID=930132 RepID=A0A6A8D7W1_9BACI|nr:TrkH family potassium uptake protein [Aquibacillus halophilus]MRH41835.1 Ktr system potassium transporter B [Aquibacillus halophilus]
MSPPHLLAVSMLTVIVIGTLFLKLPYASETYVSWIDALFTATSATTVTGLSVLDTQHDFTMFGQTIIMLLIQFGGIGLMTFAIFTLLIMGRKITLRQRVYLSSSFSQETSGGVVKLVKSLVCFVFIVETIAFVILSIRWVPIFGWKDGLFYSLFHAISAFNNAGFSTWSNNLIGFVADPIVNITITTLFIIGGLGFTVVTDLISNKRWKKLMLHTKLMITGTLVINIISMFVIFLLEYNNPDTLGSLSMNSKLIASYFQGVSPRTAGFNTINIGSMEDATLLYTMLLMFIGAGTASTASGIKLTTVIVVLLSTIAFLNSKSEPVIFKRTIKREVIIRSLAIIIISLSIVFLFLFFLSITEDASFMEVMFETVSAFGTVGLSMGITPDLTSVGKILLIFLMFIGRLGPLTFAFLLAKPHSTKVRYPSDQVFTG